MVKDTKPLRKLLILHPPKSVRARKKDTAYSYYAPAGRIERGCAWINLQGSQLCKQLILQAFHSGRFVRGCREEKQSNKYFSIGRVGKGISSFLCIMGF